jgi:diguanylate cyclase (GGDEF)-like protein
VIVHFSRQPEMHIDYVSPSFETHSGIPAATVEADLSIFADALDHDTRALLADAAAGRPLPARFDASFHHADGTRAVFEVQIVETTSGIQCVARDVTEIRALQTQLAQQATQDPLTGLANRRLLSELLDRALRRASRTGTTISVAFLDLDNFKAVNDLHGHDAGDTVLRTTATRLQTAVRDADVVARYGGDEFVIIYETSDDLASNHLAQRITDALDLPIDITDNLSVYCPASIGISDTRTTIADAAALITSADRAMLEHKRAHKRTQETRQRISTRPGLSG